jgi:MFS family permease
MPAPQPPHPAVHGAARTGLRSRAFRLLLFATAASFSGYVLLLPTVPLWAVRGGAGEFGAGSTTAVFMLVTVLTQLAMPWLLTHGGYRWTFAAGALLLAAPTPLLLLSDGLAAVLAVSAVRGIGFGMITVVGAALSARLVPAQHLGRAAGYYGVAVGIPILVFLPVGIWVALNVGFAAVFWFATLAPLAGAGAAVALWFAGGDGLREAAKRPAAGAHASGAGNRPVRSQAAVWRALTTPLLIMLALSLASSGFVTFLAIPLSEVPAVATVALLGYGLLSVVSRWIAGSVSDQRGQPALMVPSVIAGAVAMGVTAWALWPAGEGWAGPGIFAAAAIVLGATVFGAAFGAAQNDTIVAMFRRAGPEGYGTASAVWNIGFDAGTGAGALGLGIVAQTMGYGPAFALTAVLVGLCVPAARSLGRAPQTPAAPQASL